MTATFDTVINAVVTALTAENIPAARKFPACVLDRHSAAVAVSLKSGSITASGYGDYLGVCESGGEVKELYGSKAELKIGLEIFTPAECGHGEGECVELLGDICACLGELSGIKLTSFESDEPYYDGEAEMFCMKCALNVTAQLVRRSDECGGFTDFVLKGELK